MKLLTLNTHSLLEENYTSKTYSFVEYIIKEKVDVFALQEVNQSHKLPVLAENPANYYGHSMLKQNNHALYVAELLEKHGLHRRLARTGHRHDERHTTRLFGEDVRYHRRVLIFQRAQHDSRRFPQHTFPSSL